MKINWTERQEGKRSVKREIEYYSLDVIVSVGYRVKSQEREEKAETKCST